MQMVPLATVATGIDGTSATSFSFPAPDVNPYSKIYFLQLYVLLSLLGGVKADQIRCKQHQWW